ncbi:hypothetical protein C7M84_018361 [Penaeus vannamei]|uniref:Uncharacterized protein n=1 Tax=Penaeus vannamei TaxID=6689 RepID=A0A3R7MK07_PENVA|nr:hypothetical protein C7M84_018361 [Penaeus vannamei]
MRQLGRGLSSEAAAGGGVCGGRGSLPAVPFLRSTLSRSLPALHFLAVLSLAISFLTVHLCRFFPSTSSLPGYSTQEVPHLRLEPTATRMPSGPTQRPSYTRFNIFRISFSPSPPTYFSLLVPTASRPHAHLPSFAPLPPDVSLKPAKIDGASRLRAGANSEVWSLELVRILALRLACKPGGQREQYPLCRISLLRLYTFLRCLGGRDGEGVRSSHVRGCVIPLLRCRSGGVWPRLNARRGKGFQVGVGSVGRKGGRESYPFRSLLLLPLSSFPHSLFPPFLPPSLPPFLFLPLPPSFHLPLLPFPPPPSYPSPPLPLPPFPLSPLPPFSFTLFPPSPFPPSPSSSLSSSPPPSFLSSFSLFPPSSALLHSQRMKTLSLLPHILSTPFSSFLSPLVSSSFPSLPPLSPFSFPPSHPLRPLPFSSNPSSLPPTFSSLSPPSPLTPPNFFLTSLSPPFLSSHFLPPFPSPLSLSPPLLPPFPPSPSPSIWFRSRFLRIPSSAQQSSLHYGHP